MVFSQSLKTKLQKFGLISISIAAFFVAVVQLIFLFNLFWSRKHGQPSGNNPWKATTLEWQTPHP